MCVCAGGGGGSEIREIGKDGVLTRRLIDAALGGLHQDGDFGGVEVLVDVEVVRRVVWAVLDNVQSRCVRHRRGLARRVEGSISVPIHEDAAAPEPADHRGLAPELPGGGGRGRGPCYRRRRRGWRWRWRGKVDAQGGLSITDPVRAAIRGLPALAWLAAVRAPITVKAVERERERVQKSVAVVSLLFSCVRGGGWGMLPSGSIIGTHHSHLESTQFPLPLHPLGQVPNTPQASALSGHSSAPGPRNPNSSSPSAAPDGHLTQEAKVPF